ncbi:MAG: hypothetical protein IPM23_27185 [Candidatus Melainabacteria bacterium]|nr:hypothetical protein [Candidatus Melainabacteria bacterium]
MSSFEILNPWKVDQAARMIKKHLLGQKISWDPMLFSLGIYQHVFFEKMPVASPSIELDIGSPSEWLVFWNGPTFDYGAELQRDPNQQWGHPLPADHNHFTSLVGMDVANIPFADDSLRRFCPYQMSSVTKATWSVPTGKFFESSRPVGPSPR